MLNTSDFRLLSSDFKVHKGNKPAKISKDNSDQFQIIDYASYHIRVSDFSGKFRNAGSAAY